METRLGSFVAEIELAEQPDSRLIELGENAIEQVVRAIKEPDFTVSERIRDDVSRMARVLDSGIRAIRFSSGGFSATLQRLPEGNAKLPSVLSVRELSERIAVGRLLEVDWKDQTAELHTPAGVVRLRFSPALSARMQELAQSYVEVVGLTELRARDSLRDLEISNINAVAHDRTFWDPVGLQPGKLSSTGPFEFPEEDLLYGDEDIDEFLDAIFAD